MAYSSSFETAVVWNQSSAFLSAAKVIEFFLTYEIFEAAIVKL